MFLEYTMASEERFSADFGFTETETNLLYNRYINCTENPQITREACVSGMMDIRQNPVKNCTIHDLLSLPFPIIILEITGQVQDHMMRFLLYQTKHR